jgi:hypothetical protein
LPLAVSSRWRVEKPSSLTAKASSEPSSERSNPSTSQGMLAESAVVVPVEASRRTSRRNSLSWSLTV